VRTISVIAPPATGARPAAGAAWRGLGRMLSGPDPSAGGRGRSPGRRWAAGILLGAAALLLCWASVASLADGHFLGAIFGPFVVRFSAKGPSRVLGPGGRTYSAPLAGVLGTPLAPNGGDLGGDLALGVLLAVGVVAPLLLAIRHPLLGWRIGWLGLLLAPLVYVNWWGSLPWDPVQVLVVLVVACAAGTRHDRPALSWLWALTLVPWWLWIIRDGPGVVTGVVGSVAFLAMGVAADSVGSRRRAQLALDDQAEAAEVERARRAVLEERARIARELHDVVAHHMSLMAVRAESAPHRLGASPDPQQVRAEFGALSESAREALTDMRRLLGVLRSDQPAPRAPQPGLPDLPALIDTARQAGMAVQLSPLPAAGQVPPGAGLCAYRIIQEALSNAGRHAAGAPVTVSVRHDAGTVTLRVANGPLADAQPGANGHRPGQGLAGMRERAELLGGSLSAGPAPDGGFVVSAVLPLSRSPA
jgi:signal transduction histidine kinase